MSKSLEKTHLCEEHQGNGSHYDSINCEICKLRSQVSSLTVERDKIAEIAVATTKKARDLFKWLSEAQNRYVAAESERDQLRADVEKMRGYESLLLSKDNSYCDRIDEIAEALAFELEVAEMDQNDYVTVNREKLKGIAQRVFARLDSTSFEQGAESMKERVEALYMAVAQADTASVLTNGTPYQRCLVTTAKKIGSECGFVDYWSRALSLKEESPKCDHS